MKRLIGLAAVLSWLVAAAGLAPAQETASEDPEKQLSHEVVVTATRTETRLIEVGSSVAIITGRQIEESRKETVLELLRTVPALDIVQSGGPGRTTSVFIRGAKSEHTLVLVDGVEMNDPISAGRSFDFANMTTDNIERIEIIRGPQSTLYGSDAIGGVINIITKRGEGKRSGYVSVEGGAFKTIRESAGLSGGSDWVSYSLGLSRWDTGGISAASAKAGNLEKDGYGNTSFSGRLGIDPSPELGFDVILRYIDAKTDLDNAGGAGGDDPNNTAAAQQVFLRTQARISLFKNRWEQKIGLSLSGHDREYVNDVDADHPYDSEESTYKGRSFKLDWQSNLHLHKTNTLTLGVEHEQERGESDYASQSAWGPYSSIFERETARTTGVFFQDHIKLWDSWFTTVGVRIDDHDRFGSKTTYRVSSAYLVKGTGTRLKGSLGTGFKAPSLYQFYSEYGSLGLSPEKSRGWDVGVEQSAAGGRLSLGAGYFSNEFDNLIDFDSALWIYVNVAAAETHGFELSAELRPSTDLGIRASYTMTDTEDKSTGKRLLRRARDKFGFDVNWRFAGKGTFNFRTAYVGPRDDYDYSARPAARVELDGFVLADLSAAWDIYKNIRLFGRIDNLLNTDYEEVRGYGTPGRSVFAGVKVLF